MAQNLRIFTYSLQQFIQLKGGLLSKEAIAPPTMKRKVGYEEDEKEEEDRRTRQRTNPKSEDSTQNGRKELGQGFGTGESGMSE